MVWDKGDGRTVNAQSVLASVVQALEELIESLNAKDTRDRQEYLASAEEAVMEARSQLAVWIEPRLRR